MTQTNAERRAAATAHRSGPTGDAGLSRQLTWAGILGHHVPGWDTYSDRTKRAVQAKGSIAGYRVFGDGMVWELP